MSDDEQRFMKEAGDILRQADADLDATTLSRLARGRNAALGWASGRNRSRWGALSVAGLGATFACVAVAAFILLRPQGERSPGTDLVADIGLLTSEESVEFFEDMEFYEWLSEAQGVEGEMPSAPGAFHVPGSVDPGVLPTSTRGRDTGTGSSGISRVI